MKAPNLADFAPGEGGSVLSLPDDPLVRLRLMELGVLPGSYLQLVRRAPLGCPLEVDSAGTRWAIRRDLAKEILMEPHAD